MDLTEKNPTVDRTRDLTQVGLENPKRESYLGGHR